MQLYYNDREVVTLYSSLHTVCIRILLDHHRNKSSESTISHNPKRFKLTWVTLDLCRFGRCGTELSPFDFLMLTTCSWTISKLISSYLNKVKYVVNRASYPQKWLVYKIVQGQTQ